MQFSEGAQNFCYVGSFMLMAGWSGGEGSLGGADGSAGQSHLFIGVTIVGGFGPTNIIPCPYDECINRWVLHAKN